MGMEAGTETDNLFLYERLSRRLLELISGGAYAEGERLPSVRQLSRLFGVSISTVIQCYRHLELAGHLEARPQSGFFVRGTVRRTASTAPGARFPLLPVEVSLSERVLHYMELHARPDIVRFGIALPSPEIVPVQRLMQTLRETLRRHSVESWEYMHPNGHAGLLHQLARRTLTHEVALGSDDLLITSGCMEALTLGIRSVSKPGDAIAVESPTYYGTLLLLEAHQRQVVEIPTHPQTGISLSALERVFARRAVAACVVSANAQNPLGFTLSAERKRALVALAERHQIPLIENDVWGDTVFEPGAAPAKAFDREGWVIYCNSFSKTLIPGVRVGWAAPGRFLHRFRELKQLSTITSPSAPQIALARLLETGFYDQHLTALRTQLRQQVAETAGEVLAHFPAGTRLEAPSGGCVLWARLPQGCDSERLFEQAAEAGIHIFPGSVFSVDGHHRDHLRINAGSALTERSRQALKTLGEFAHAQLEQTTHTLA